MKRIVCVLLALLIAASLAACNETTPAATDVDLDLTKLSSTMVYAEVSNMMTNPSGYTGKTVKMQGTFAVYHDDATGKNYFACLIADATACCSQGIEFVLAGDHTYPADYPEIGSEIAVRGTFGTYFEGEYMYCQLTDAEWVK